MVSSPEAHLRHQVFDKARLVNRFLSPEDSAELFASLWAQKELASTTDVGGSPTSRKMIWIAENPEWVYFWGRDHSGQKPRPWTKQLLKLRDLVCEEIRRQRWILPGKEDRGTFNAVLINYYEDGAQGTDWHSDQDRWLGDRPLVASISLGETRALSVRLKTDKTVTIDIPLEDGSLLLMNEDFQSKFHHRVPMSENAKGVRINLTFRRIIPELATLPVEKLAAD